MSGGDERKEIPVDKNEASTIDSDSIGSSTSLLQTGRQMDLAERLRRILLCTICLDLPPPDKIFQCTRGHIMCEDCSTRLLADANLGFRMAKCPHCRTYMNWWDLQKNRVLDQVVAELPRNCPNCNQLIESKDLSAHKIMECPKRRVSCKYRCLGCRWSGIYTASKNHEASCEFMNKSSDEILSILTDSDNSYRNRKPLLACFEALSSTNIVCEDIKLLWPILFICFNPEIRFLSAGMYAFNYNWQLRLKLATNEGSVRTLSYALQLLTSPDKDITLKYYIALPSGNALPHKDTDLFPEMQQTTFSRLGQLSKFTTLLVNGSKATYRLLSRPRIMLRVWLFAD